MTDPMTDHDTTPGAPETEARDALLLTLASADGQPWGSIAEASRHTAEIMYGKQADAVIAAGWISPTEAATRDAAQRAAGHREWCRNETCLRMGYSIEQHDQAQRAAGAETALRVLADEHERIADSLAITFQNAKDRERATWPHRWLVHIIRGGAS